MVSVSVLRDVLAGLSHGDQEVAMSLIDQAESRGLSAKQSALVERLVIRAVTPKVPKLNVQPLVDFIHEANTKRPILLLMTGGENSVQLRLSVAGPSSRTPGFIVVTSPGSWNERTFYGRIDSSGDFEPAYSMEPEQKASIEAALKAMSDDPAGTAAKFGKFMGWCCFCRIPLSDPKSLEVGYGKVCAQKYHLPYGASR